MRQVTQSAKCCSLKLVLFWNMVNAKDECSTLKAGDSYDICKLGFKSTDMGGKEENKEVQRRYNICLFKRIFVS